MTVSGVAWVLWKLHARDIYWSQVGHALAGVHATETEVSNVVETLRDALEKRTAAHETAMLRANQDLAELKA